MHPEAEAQLSEPGKGLLALCPIGTQNYANLDRIILHRETLLRSVFGDLNLMQGTSQEHAS